MLTMTAGNYVPYVTFKNASDTSSDQVVVDNLEFVFLTTQSYGDYSNTSSNITYRGREFRFDLRIPFYSIIFILSVIGNVLVIVTLIQHRRMRTVTNVFLLNLSVSDLLLSVVCMPFTLIPTLLQNFIFGKAMCILIRYLQGELTLFLVLLFDI